VRLLTEILFDNLGEVMLASDMTPVRIFVKGIVVSYSLIYTNRRLDFNL
jgi:hypothetical protein